MSTGKKEIRGKNEVVVVDRPLQRAYELFFAGHVHDVSFCHSDERVFVTSKCWATQKKSKKYEQKLVFSESSTKESGSSCTVQYACCVGCVAGGDGCLCSHVFAVLEALSSQVVQGNSQSHRCRASGVQGEEAFNRNL